MQDSLGLAYQNDEAIHAIVSLGKARGGQGGRAPLRQSGWAVSEAVGSGTPGWSEVKGEKKNLENQKIQGCLYQKTRNLGLYSSFIYIFLNT